jgi:hypothetical protein
MRKFWLLAVSLLLGAAVLSAKSYSIHLDQTCMVGTQQIKAGDYKLNVEGTKVVFKNDMGKDVLDVTAKVQNSADKYAYTALEISRVSGTNHITSIHLQDSKTTLVFN